MVTICAVQLLHRGCTDICTRKP